MNLKHSISFLVFAAWTCLCLFASAAKYSLPSAIGDSDSSNDRHRHITYVLLTEADSLQVINGIAEHGDDQQRFSLAYMNGNLYESAVTFLNILPNLDYICKSITLASLHGPQTTISQVSMITADTFAF